MHFVYTLMNHNLIGSATKEFIGDKIQPQHGKLRHMNIE